LETDSVWLLKKTPSSGGFEDLHADYKKTHGFMFKAHLDGV